MIWRPLAGAFIIDAGVLVGGCLDAPEPASLVEMYWPATPSAPVTPDPPRPSNPTPPTPSTTRPDPMIPEKRGTPPPRPRPWPPNR
jgi:hypothetical protein